MNNQEEISHSHKFSKLSPSNTTKPTSYNTTNTVNNNNATYNYYSSHNGSDNMTVIRLMKELSEALNGRGRTVDKLQIHLQELLIKLQMEEQELMKSLQ